MLLFENQTRLPYVISFQKAKSFHSLRVFLILKISFLILLVPSFSVMAPLLHPVFFFNDYRLQLVIRQEQRV